MHPTVRQLLILTTVLYVIAIGVDLGIGSSPTGFSATVGLGGCVALVLGAKWLGKRLLSRPDTYYATTERAGPGQPELQDELQNKVQDDA